MISYSWNNQETRKVHKFLEDKGCDVWCDERKVVGNLVDAMVKALFAFAFFEYGLCIRNRLHCFVDEASSLLVEFSEIRMRLGVLFCTDHPSTLFSDAFKSCAQPWLLLAPDHPLQRSKHSHGSNGD